MLNTFWFYFTVYRFIIILIFLFIYYCSYGTGTLTKVFLERVFQECLTYDGEMDYKTYLDFVLALENRHEPQSLHYLFRILDVKNQGYLDTFSLNYFFRVNYRLVIFIRCMIICRFYINLFNLVKKNNVFIQKFLF